MNNKKEKYILEYIELTDLEKTNDWRWAITKSGGDLRLLKEQKKPLDNLNKWLNYSSKVTDPIKTGLTLLMTMNTGEWQRLINATNKTQITSILTKAMRKRTEFTGGTLWNFVDTRRTTSQLASGIALSDWDTSTIKAIFSNEDELIRIFETHRG